MCLLSILRWFCCSCAWPPPLFAHPLCTDRLTVWEAVRAEFVKVLGKRASFLATGGAPTPPVVAKWVEKVWRGKRLVNSYGATEVHVLARGGCDVVLVLPSA